MAVAKKAELEAVMDTAACLLAAQAMAMDEAIIRLSDKDTDEDRRREALDALRGALYVVGTVRDELAEKSTGKVA